MEKSKFRFDGAIGKPYGTQFEVKEKNLVVSPRVILNETLVKPGMLHLEMML